MIKPLTYADAGVDINKADRFVDRIKEIAKPTFGSSVIGGIGGFGGLFSLKLQDISNPVLVSSTDGVGTKLKIAFMTDKHDTIGIDLVAMCVNDVVVQGAKPLFFLDYLAMGALKTDTAVQIVKGIVDGCTEAGCALIGGETAEMPGFYQRNEYDLAGFAVGIVDNRKIIDGSEIKVGDRLVGIASSGLHSNGFSLVRKICFDLLRLNVNDTVPELGSTLGDILLTPTKIYVKSVLRLAKDNPIHGLAHITGGGITGNIVRIIPESCGIIINKGSWKIPPVFEFLKESGNVSDEEMMRTFNNGIGMVAILPEENVRDAIERLNAMNENGFVIGEIVKRDDSNSRVQWV
ncbi:MAG: phosphoribosylformylglycinamidine cyclo-ligase [Deltaproteobacteria bacterium RBG_13_49_15]|nr:MAG: phosphoribosylformylglycinamidine cyclo-ligase [Deltaproteobacteria bacterium RBG_13_49_15]